MKRVTATCLTILLAIIFTSAQSATKKRLTFEPTIMADGFDPDATQAGFRSPNMNHVHFGITVYQASDGQKLNVTNVSLRDEEEAHRYFDWYIGRAGRVTKKADERNAEGKVVGKRAEVVPKSGSGCAVIRTVGANFQEFLAVDCDHVYAIQKM